MQKASEWRSKREVSFILEDNQKGPDLAGAGSKDKKKDKKGRASKSEEAEGECLKNGVKTEVSKCKRDLKKLTTKTAKEKEAPLSPESCMKAKVDALMLKTSLGDKGSVAPDPFKSITFGEDTSQGQGVGGPSALPLSSTMGMGRRSRFEKMYQHEVRPPYFPWGFLHPQ